LLKGGSVPHSCVTRYCCGVSFFFSSSAEGFVVAAADVAAGDAFDVVVSTFFSSCFCAPARLRKVCAPISPIKTMTQMTSRKRERGSGRWGKWIIDDRAGRQLDQLACSRTPAGTRM